jgi:hypothetical protein
VVSEVSLWCSPGHPGPITLFPTILFSWGAQDKKKEKEKEKRKSKKRKKVMQPIII